MSHTRPLIDRAAQYYNIFIVIGIILSGVEIQCRDIVICYLGRATPADQLLLP